MATKVSVQFHFKCPVHGNEYEVFCYRGTEPENLHLWQKYSVIYIEDDATDKELQACVDGLKATQNRSALYPLG